jgi:hypothetical protein
MNGYEVDGIECETSLLAETPETRQHFFLFFPDFLFLPVITSCRVTCEGRREVHLLAERVKACQYFFKDFLILNHEWTRMASPR